MLRLSDSLTAWEQTDFAERFCAEVTRLNPAQLPLQQGLAQSSCVADAPFQVMLLSSTESGHELHIRTGIAYSGSIAGCSCADDPSPPALQPEYCELAFTIDRHTAEARVALLPG